MENLQFASDPSDPLWVEPSHQARHCIDVTPGRPRRWPYKAPVMSPEQSVLIEVLDQAASDLERLARLETPLADFQVFFTQWDDPPGSGRTQPNALAWFNDTYVLETICSFNQPDVLQFLLEKGIVPTNRAASTAGGHFRKTNDSHMLQHLLDHGWDINAPLYDNVPPVLCDAVGHIDRVQWCLDRGSIVDVSASDGTSIMHCAAKASSVDELKLLVSLGGRIRGTNALAHAAWALQGPKHRDMEVMRYLLDQGALVDAYLIERDDVGKTDLSFIQGWRNALHFAVSGGYMDTVRLLLERGADPTLEAMTMESRKAVLPVELARIYGHEDIAIFLESLDTATTQDK